MKKIIKKGFLASFAAMFIAVGAFGFVKTKDAKLVETRAENITESTTLYLHPGNNWRDGGPKYAAYFFGDGEEWKWMDPVENQMHIYSVTGTAGKNYTNVIFTRQDPVATTPNWDNKWDQTTDLTYTSPKNLYVVPDDAWNNSGNEHWQAYNPTDWAPEVVKTPTTEGITSSKMRIWINRGAHYAAGGFSYLLHVGDTYYDATGYEKAIVWGDGALYFPFYDVEIAEIVGKQVGLTILNDGTGKVEVEIPAQTFNEGDNNKIIHPIKSDAGIWSYKSDYQEGRLFNSFAAKVLEGYLTCSASVSNGYGAFPTLDANIIVRPGGVDEWNLEGDLGDINIQDYAALTDYETGNRTVEIDAYTKYVALQQQYNNSLSGAMQTRVVATNNSLLIATIVIAVLGISLIAYVSYRKKLHA